MASCSAFRQSAWKAGKGASKLHLMQANFAIDRSYEGGLSLFCSCSHLRFNLRSEAKERRSVLELVSCNQFE